MVKAAGVLVLSAAVLVAGCTTGDEAGSSAPAATSAPPPEPALSIAGAKSFYRTYDAAQATAMNAANGRSYDRSRLSKILLGPDLDGAILRSKLLQAERKTTKVKPSTSVRALYAPLSADGPQAVIAAISVSKKSWEGLRVLRRSAPEQAWRAAVGVTTSLATLPEPADPAEAEPSSKERALARSVVAKVIKFIDGGKASGFVPGAAIDQIRTFDTEEERVIGDKKTKLWGKSTKDGTEPGGPIVVTRTADGLLVVAAVETAVTVKPRYGGPIFYRAPYDKVFGVSGNRSSITNYYAVGVVITVPAKGKPVVVGAEGANILPPASR